MRGPEYYMFLIQHKNPGPDTLKGPDNLVIKISSSGKAKISFQKLALSVRNPVSTILLHMSTQGESTSQSPDHGQHGALRLFRT